MKKIYTLIVLIISSIIAGCGGSVVTIDDIEKPSNGSDITTYSNIQETNNSKYVDLVSDINNGFAFSLHSEDREQNNFLSSYNLSLMLNILLNGAAGETKEEMLKTMNVTISAKDWEDNFNTLHSDVLKFLDKNNSSSFRFKFANSFWIQKGLDIQQQYITKMEKNYGLNMQFVDFNGSSETALEKINNWTSQMTDNHIQNIMDTKLVNKNSKIIVVSAMHLKALWSKSFFHNDTKQRQFQLLDESNITIPIMHQINKFRYVKKDGIEAVCMKYKKSDFGLISFLPQKGKFREFEESLDNDILDYFADDFKYKKLDLYYPKFEIYSDSINLTDMLIEKGMDKAFSQNADFSLIEPSKSLNLSQVVQQIYFKIDEEGTEAASATSISIGETNAEDKTVVKFNRPFIVMICHIPSRTILFMGRVLNPMQ